MTTSSRRLFVLQRRVNFSQLGRVWARQGWRVWKVGNQQSDAAANLPPTRFSGREEEEALLLVEGSRPAWRPSLCHQLAANARRRLEQSSLTGRRLAGVSGDDEGNSNSRATCRSTPGWNDHRVRGAPSLCRSMLLRGSFKHHFLQKQAV